LTTRPSFRKPWQHGAKAYHEADSLEALAKGVRRKRNPLTVLIPHATHALDGTPCAACGLDLAGPYAVNPGDEPTTTDRHCYADVDPKRGTVALRHYYCAWGHTMNQVLKLRDLGVA